MNKVSTTTHTCHRTARLGCAVHGHAPCNGITYLHEMTIGDRRRSIASQYASPSDIGMATWVRAWNGGSHKAIDRRTLFMTLLFSRY